MLLIPFFITIMEKETKYLAYKIIPDLKLILEYYSGSVKGDDAIKLRTIQKDDSNYNSEFNVLIDFRDLILNWTDKSDEALARFIKFMKKNSTLISRRKSSILVTKPAHAVLSTFLTEYYDKFPMRMDSFSTMEAALENIDIPNGSFQRVIEEIEKIKNDTQYHI